MKVSILDSFSDVAFANIVKKSNSLKECALNLGYHAYTNVVMSPIKERINRLKLDTSHFYTHKSIERTFENIFCKDSTASGSTVRKWYKKGEYTPYVCAICGQEPFWNGKEMSLILDHINGVNNDHRLKNLRWVCPNCNIQLDTTNGKNQNHGIRVRYYCIDCGEQVFTKTTVRCKNCENKRRKAEHKIDELNEVYSFPNSNRLVHRRELKELIRSNPFTKVGEHYGVSDNAIRKWCKTMGLPSRASDILKISDKDWENI